MRLLHDPHFLKHLNAKSVQITGRKKINPYYYKLSIREKIGQTMIVRAFHKSQVEEFGSIENMMKTYPIGGLFIPWWDYLNTPPRNQVISTIKKAVLDYENASKYPMIVTEDFERGVGSIYSEFTNMPSEMALGAANRTDLAYKFGNAIAKESNVLGINWLLHPLVDLNMNPLQDLVIERAISDDATRAYPLLKAQIQGMNAQGVVATIKHFPGDGATIKNQHLITSANNLSVPEWNATFGTLYQKMINNGAPCIMVGHIRFPAYQKEKRNGVLLPASLSEELMVGLLKKKMKFNGIIMSDALNMGGVARAIPWFHLARIVFVECFFRIGHVRVFFPCFRNQHHHYFWKRTTSH